MVNIYWLRPKVGDALWLWQLLNGYTKYVAQDEWLLVADARPVTEMDIGALLFCTEETVKDWRQRLEAAGLVRSTVVPDRSPLEWRKYEVLNLNFGAVKAETPLGSGAVH